MRTTICRALIASGLLCGLLFAGTVTHAQLPDAPKPKVIDRRFVAVYGALGIAKAVDMGLTARNISRGAIETNPIFGPRPSTGRLIGVNLGYFGGELAIGYGLKRFGLHHRWARALWLIEPSFQIADHARCIRHNIAH